MTAFQPYVRSFRSAWLILGVLASLATAACSSEKPPAVDPEEGDVDENSDVTSTLDGADAGGGGDTGGDAGDGSAQDANGPSDGGGDGDGGPASDAVDAADDVTEQTDAGGGDAKADASAPKLPLPECAGPITLSDTSRCANCATKCKEQPICGPNKKTYKNDCEAICDLKAFDGLKGEWSQKACPACSFCGAGDKPDGPWCVTLNSGAKVEVQLSCEALCLDAKKDAAGAPVKYKGACKSACSNPAPAGGGCNFTKYLPVCAKEDGKTYAGMCHMQNCDLNGCFPVGETKQSATCAPDKMTKECDGECYDAAKTPSCPKECNPVCGIVKATATSTAKGRSFRNLCIAKIAGATVNSCEGISATATDVCSGSLYAGKGCCPDVDYSIVKQVCASKADKWVTFRSQSEFNCLTDGDKDWVFQYQGPCVCNCANLDKPVCGDDGQTYSNKCQAECYNPGGKFSYKDGPC